MTLETFFEKFELFADTPDAVVNMRELVLRTAVQGKLVRQDLNEEPASELIRRAVQARKQLVAAGLVRDEVPELGFSNQIDNNLPAGWVLAPLSIYVGVIMGQSPPSSAYNESGEGLPFYQGKAQFGQLYPTATNWCTEPTKIGEPGDVVISVRAPVGPTNVLRERSCIGRGLAALRSLGGEQMHLLYTLRALERDIAALGVGSTFVAVSKYDLDTFLIPVPPLAEQRRIVAKVDELMALCDRLEAQQQERETRHAALARASLARFADAPTSANLNFLFHDSYSIDSADLHKTILTLAIQGDLSSGSSDPVAWSEVKMKEVCDLITDGEHATPQRVASGIPLATAKNVRDGFLDMSQTDYVALETAEKCWKRCKPKDQDILMVCVGATTGRVCLVRNPPDMVLVRSVSLLRPNIQRIEPTFLDLFLRSPSGQSQIWGGVRQNAQPCLYLGKMSEFTIQLPSIAEQRRIVEKVDELMALVDALETQLATARTLAEKLMEAVVAELTTLD